MLGPDKASILGHGGLSLKAFNIADLGDDAGGIDLTDARDGCQGVGNNFKLLLDCFVQVFDLLNMRGRRYTAPPLTSTGCCSLPNIP